MCDNLPTSYEAYDEMMSDLYAPHYSSEYEQAAAEMSNADYQRYIGGADYIYGNCPRCNACLWTGEEHTAQECYENRVEIAEFQLLKDIQATYQEFHPPLRYVGELPF